VELGIRPVSVTIPVVELSSWGDTGMRESSDKSTPRPQADAFLASNLMCRRGETRRFSGE